MSFFLLQELQLRTSKHYLQLNFEARTIALMRFVAYFFFVFIKGFNLRTNEKKKRLR
jgi:hypothetical protein